jgi:pyruvate formate lyase activating enzyme
MKEAAYWRKVSEEAGQCLLCPHFCRIREGRTGKCKVRSFLEGRLMAASYGRVSSAHLDPMEKKPLYHFHPGQPIFSIGGWGCNLSCLFCQNWSISQQGSNRDGGEDYPPESIVDTAAENGSSSIAYTYNEPVVNFEFVRDVAKLAKARGMNNVLVTNGFINPEPAAELLPLIDALNVDIKCIENDFYERQCGGAVKPVLDFCVQARRAGCHIEITNLVIPNLNDQPGQVAELAAWVKENLGETTPLHLSAYRPEYRMKTPAPPRALMEKAWNAAAAILPYVYLGNMLSDHGSSTRCPACKNEWIRRSGYTIQTVGLDKNAACRQCGRAADVII